MQLSAKFMSSITLAASLASAFVISRQAAPGDYILTFTNQTGAVQGLDFITFDLVKTTASMLSLPAYYIFSSHNLP
jgi:hypothetical protein